MVGGRNYRRRHSIPAHGSAEKTPRGPAGPCVSRLASSLGQGNPASGPLWCATCCNTGEVDCYCGGELCVCARYGITLCPACGGRLAWAEAASAGTA